MLLKVMRPCLGKFMGHLNNHNMSNGVSPTKLARVIVVQVFMQDLLKSKFFKKLVGMKFNVED